MATIFTRIVNGEIPCHKLAENDKFLAFLDVRPIREGHALVIPKEEIDYVFDVPDELLSGLLLFAKRVARAIKKEIPCKKVGVMVAGLEVPHTHIHLVPIDAVSDLNFSHAKPAAPEALAQTAERIRRHLA